MIRKYEVMYIINQDTTDVKAVQKKLHDVLIANGGKILESEDWGLKDFAYLIKKKRKGYYSVVIVETDSANINEFERISRIDKNVVRYQVINTENEKKYIQSTKLSKTDMSKFKEEKKPSRGFYKRMPRREENNKSEETNDIKNNNEAKSTIIKKPTTKKVEEKEA